MIFLEPMTAPSPPRPWLRILLSGSLTEMLAAVILISPAGPMVRTPVFLPSRCLEGVDHLVVPFADQFRLFADCGAVLVDVEAVPLRVLGRHAFDDQRLDAEPGQVLCRGAAGVDLLDGAGQRALGAGREPPGLGCGGAGEQAGGKDQFVVLAERVAGGWDFLRRRWSR